jgi:AIPR protein
MKLSDTLSGNITFPVVSFRNIETPFQRQGYRDYLAVVDIRHLPDLKNWRKINVRDPKLTGSVPRAIRDSVHTNPDLFLFLNRGIVLSVDSVSFNNKNSELTLSMTDPNLHGLLDGGHTYTILRDEKETMEESQYVKIEILEGFRQDEIPMLVDARNTSNQVRDQSLMNLQGEFDKLKHYLQKEPYADLIAYKEYELSNDGSPKPIDVREIIAILICFDKVHFNDRVHPINAYRSKAACLQHFSRNRHDFERLYPLAPQILKLYDYVQLLLPELYNRVRAESGEVMGGKFGKLTGVTTYDGKGKAYLYFIDQTSKYGVPAGFIYPVLAAFRAFIVDWNGRFAWAKGIDPFNLLDGPLGETLAETIGNFALDTRNPSKTGKSPLVWQACYQAAQVAYLTRLGAETGRAF